MGNTSIEPSPLFRLQVRIASRAARRCPACRRTWPFDWEYCSSCDVWLPGNECSERRALLVPTAADSSTSAADVDARVVLACQVECPTEQPRPEDVRHGSRLFESSVEAIAASGGRPRVVHDAGVMGSWGDHTESASSAAGAALVGAHPGDAASARRARFGMGISSHGERHDVQRFAFRLASLASPDSILVCEEVYRRTRQRFDYRGVGPAVPRSEPLPGLVFQLTRAKPERSGSRHSGPERAPLGGRRELLGTLDDCRQHVERGQCVVVHVIGEPGSGKSKLLREWLAPSERDQRCAGWLRLETDGVPYGGFPLRAWERLVAPLGGREENQRRHVTCLMPDQVRQRIEASGRRGLIVVDDLHWVDGDSRTALGELLKEIATLPVLVLLAYRHSFADAAPKQPPRVHRRLRLRGWSATDMRARLGRLGAAAGADLSSADEEEIVAQAGGNPLYAEEAVAHLVEVAGRAERSPLPSSLPELLIRRTEWTLAYALPELERRHRAGLFTEGMRFALGLEREAILRDLDALEERLASWLDRLDVVEGAAPALVRQFVEGLDAIDGRLALMSLLLGRQRPHCGRLAQALARLGAGRERAG